MRLPLIDLPTPDRSGRWAAPLIAVGVTLLLFALAFPPAPAVTAMALIALGATAATVSRCGGTPWAAPVVLAHLAIYGTLYALFVGATLHAASARSGPRLDVFAMLDVTTSVVPMILAIRLAWSALESQSADGR